MIHFACPGCRKNFTVPDAFAGRTGRCKACGTPFVTPMPEDEAARTVAKDTEFGRLGKLPPRTRRLIADAERVRQRFENFDRIRVTPIEGDPPETYRVEYFVSGLELDRKNRPVPRDLHEVEIRLTRDYPRLAPVCRMLTPVFHPNIDTTTVCIGDLWVAGEQLADLIVRIGEMLAFQAYNIKSPLNAEAAMWTDLNTDKLPTDPRDLTPPER